MEAKAPAHRAGAEEGGINQEQPKCRPSSGRLVNLVHFYFFLSFFLGDFERCVLLNSGVVFKFYNSSSSSSSSRRIRPYKGQAAAI